MKRASREAVDGRHDDNDDYDGDDDDAQARNIARLSDVVARECIRRIEALPLSSLLPRGDELIELSPSSSLASVSPGNSCSSTARDHATSIRGELARRFAAARSLARNDYSGAPPELITRPSV